MTNSYKNTKPFFYQNDVEYYMESGPFVGAYANVYKVHRIPEILNYGHTVALKIFKKYQDKNLCADAELKGLIALSHKIEDVPKGEWTLRGLVRSSNRKSSKSS